MPLKEILEELKKYPNSRVIAQHLVPVIEELLKVLGAEKESKPKKKTTKA